MDYHVVTADVENAPAPDELFARIADLAHVFFLDSALPMADIGRYSFLGWDPFLEIRCKDTGATVRSRGLEYPTAAPPFDALAAALSKFKVLNDTALPFPCGVVGFCGYNLARSLEYLPHPAKFGQNDEETMWFGFYDTVVTYDHQEQRVFISSAVDRAGNSLAGEPAAPKLARVKSLLSQNARGQHVKSATRPLAQNVTASLQKPDYCAAVERIKRYIYAGDVYQVNLSTQYSAAPRASGTEIYLRLREVNPAPFGAYVDTGKQQILSSSPERFLYKRGASIETRPIKGTKPKSPGDTLLTATSHLLSSQKDRAELTMIIDVERNDFGRVCEYGSVAVPRMFGVEEYQTVYHLVATVVGKLRDSEDVVGCLKACFPGGSITGAPKIRAMQIIDELEPVSRGAYTGSLGYITFDGNCDLNILIRSMVIQDNELKFNVGAGIVADSVPEQEYEECLAKGAALTRCLLSPD